MFWLVSHEVVITPATVETINRRRDAGESLWRVSSTLFSHIASDQTLQPLPPFVNPDTVQNFPPIKAGNQVKAELEAISLLK